MGEYIVMLNDEQEEFLDLYLSVCPLRPEHSRKDYPSVVIHNFLDGLMKNNGKFRVIYDKKHKGKEFKSEWKQAKENKIKADKIQVDKEEEDKIKGGKKNVN